MGDHVCDSSQLKERPYLMRTGHVKQPSIVRHKSAFKLDGISHEQSNKKQEFFKLNLNITDAASPKYEQLDMRVNLAAGDVIFYLRPETIYGLTEVLIKNVLPSNEEPKNGR